MAINIAFASDTRDFLRGTGDAEKGLDRVGDALDDVARDGDKTSDKLERSFRDITRKAKSGAEDVGDGYRKGFKEAEDGADKFKRSAGEATGEFKDEAKQNFSEVASSFTGDMDSAVDLVQGSLGGLASTDLPGVGIAAGVAAAGIGAVYTALNTQAEATKQRIEDMATAMIETNSKVLQETFIQQAAQAIITEADGAVISLKNLRTASEQTGESEATLARIYAGDQGLRAEALERVRAKYAEAAEDAVSLDNQIAASGTIRMGELGRWQADLIKLGEEYDSATSKVDLMREVNRLAGQEEGTRLGHTMEEYRNLQRAIEQTPANKTVTLSVEADLSAAERSIRTWRPVIEGQVRFGRAVV